MAPLTWENCFDYAIRLSQIGKHPPFSTKINLHWSRVQVSFLCLLGVRMIMTIITGEEGLLLSFISICLITNATIRTSQLYIRVNDYKDYMSGINVFLSMCESNPVTEQRNLFMEIWKKEKPYKIATVLLIASIVFIYSWCFLSVYTAYVSEKIPKSLFWSPYFDHSVYIQWFYVLHELVLAFSMVYVPWYLDMTVTSLTKFHHAQMIYLKRLTQTLPENGYRLEKREYMIWWIRIHQQVLGSIYKANDLLGLHALSSYLTQTFFAVLSIVVLLFRSLNLSDTQRIFCISVSISQLLGFGYTCITIDKWVDEQNAIREALFCEMLMKCDKWMVTAYKIIMARMNINLKFTGLNFVTLNSITFRGMVINIYSLYTSLISVLNSKTPEL